MVYPGISQKTAHITLKPQAGVSLVSTALGNVAYVCTMDHVPTLNKQAFWKMDEEYKGWWKMGNLYAVCEWEHFFLKHTEHISFCCG